jgi:phospholipase/carboxylesterase
MKVFMNRLVLDSENAFASAMQTSTHDLHELTTLDCRRAIHDEPAPHATFAPIHYEANYAYPLLVWLHGQDSNEHELRQVMPKISMRNYVGVAPQGTWKDSHYSGRHGWRQAIDMVEDAESRIADCIAAAQRRFNIHPKRIFLAGHGSGATMAVRVAWNDPGRYAGVISVNGPLPTRQSPLRRVKELRSLPCLLSTSRESNTYPQSQVCEDLRLLHAAGCIVALRQYPGPDGLTKCILEDVDRWIMELVCGASCQ